MNVSNLIAFVLAVSEYFFNLVFYTKNMSSITEENKHDFILVSGAECTKIYFILRKLGNKIPSNTYTQYNERCQFLAQLNNIYILKPWISRRMWIMTFMALG